jgi:hypothetical protein
MRPDKKFLARLLGVNESDIANIKGLTFELANAPEELKTFKDLLSERLTGLSLGSNRRFNSVPIRWLSSFLYPL